MLGEMLPLRYLRDRAILVFKFTPWTLHEVILHKVTLHKVVFHLLSLTLHRVTLNKVREVKFNPC